MDPKIGAPLGSIRDGLIDILLGKEPDRPLRTIGSDFAKVYVEDGLESAKSFHRRAEETKATDYLMLLPLLRPQELTEPKLSCGDYPKSAAASRTGLRPRSHIRRPDSDRVFSPALDPGSPPGDAPLSLQAP